jgi:DNA-binding beta-propeller fold protein YncE
VLVAVAAMMLLGASSASASLSYVGQFGGNGVFGDAPQDVAVDPTTGHVYVSDMLASRVLVFDSTGHQIGTITHDFSQAIGVAVDSSNGNLYVTTEDEPTTCGDILGFSNPFSDDCHPRVDEFDSSGNFLRQWGSWGTGNGQFGYLAGVAVDPSSHDVYVTDTTRIEKFDASGNYLGQFGSQGNGAGQFAGTGLLGEVAVDPATGDVYAIDWPNGRVEKFDSSGSYLSQLSSSYPSGVAVDSRKGDVYVVDQGTVTVQRFDQAGDLLDQFGSSGSGDGQFGSNSNNILYGPAGIAVNPSLGVVYVADRVNDRVEWWSIASLQQITFSSTPPTNRTYGGSYTPAATGGGSGNPVIFSIDSSSTTGACVMAGQSVSFTGVGTCVVDANQAGGDGYDPAPQAQQSFTIGPAPQMITFTSSPPANPNYGGSYTPTATGGGSGNPVVFSVAGSTGSCAMSGQTVLFTAPGKCVVSATQAGNADWSAAAQQQQMFAIAPAVVHVDANPASKTYGQPDPAASGTLRASDFVNGDNASVATGSPSCQIASHSEDAGTYTGVISCGPGTLQAADYRLVAGNAADLTINKATTSIAVASSQNPVQVSNSVTFTATVSTTAGGGNPPTGTVSFTDDGSPVTGCTSAVLSAGTATCSVIYTTAIATQNIVTTYSGDGNFLGSSSSTLSELVTQGACATLAGCNLHGGNLAGANLSGANLSGANLSGANLTNANVTNATLSRANLRGANLTGANLTGANLSGANLSGVIWSNTTCPDGTNSDADGGTCVGHL